MGGFGRSDLKHIPGWSTASAVAQLAQCRGVWQGHSQERREQDFLDLEHQSRRQHLAIAGRVVLSALARWDLQFSIYMHSRYECAPCT